MRSGGRSPSPFLKGRGHPLHFSEWTPTRVAPMSITGGRSAQTPAVDECSPAGAHARCLAVLRARPRRPRRPRRGRSGSPTSRETMGSEATDPRISFSRRGERSDRHRPPRVARTAGSAMTLPGSRTDHGRRHADRAPQSSLPSPAPGRLRSAASPRPAPPQQHPRTPHPPTECNSLIFHHEDALPLKLSDLSNPHHPKRNDTPPRLQHPNNENSRLGSRAGCRAPRDRGR